MPSSMHPFIPATSFAASFGYGLIYIFQQGMPDTYNSFRATAYCTGFVFALLNLCHIRTNLIRLLVRVFMWNFGVHVLVIDLLLFFPVLIFKLRFQ